MIKNLKITTVLNYLIMVLLATSLLCFVGYHEWINVKEANESRNVNRLRLESPRHLNVIHALEIQKNISDRSHFSFIVLGDSQDNYDKFKQILNDAMKHKPDFIIHVGDFTKHGSYDEYKRAITLLHQINIPFILIPGNHEIENHGMEYFALLIGYPDFYFDIGRYRFICLNNNNRGVDPQIFSLLETPREIKNCMPADGFDRNEISDIEHLLQSKDHNFIFMHQPPPIGLSLGRHFTRNADLFMDLLQKKAQNVQYVFSGHLHGYAEVKHKGVTYIVSGGAGARLHSTHNGLSGKYNYILVSVADSDVSKSVYFIE